MSGRLAKILVPLLVGVLALMLWEWMVAALEISHLVLPAPSRIWAAFIAQQEHLLSATWATLRIAVLAFGLAVLGGIVLAVLFNMSRVVETALYPYAVILQVTPIVAIAPIVTIWIGYEQIDLVLLLLASIVAFFPILANMTLGLRSVDPNLRDLFRLSGASHWQILTQLQLPSALPYLLSAMKVAGGLALIGVVVAEFAAGSGSATGLAWTITLATRNLHIDTGFAALALLSLLGIVIFFALSALEWLLLHRWHDSAVRREL